MVKMSGETILLYNVHDKKIQKKYQLLCLKLGLRVKSVPKEQWLEPVGALIGVKDILLTGTKYEGEGFEDPMMILKIYSNRKLEQFLDGARKEGIPKINYKAVLTEYNKEWDSLHLYEELKKEHEAMSVNRSQS